MSTFLVSIISEQSAPNFLFIKEFQNQVDKFLFLTTDAMEKLNKTKQICDAANIDKEKRIKTNINEDFLEQSINKLGKLPLSSDNHYLVNLTGGTKMMAIAVWRFFHQFKNVRFFYVPLNKGVYNELFDDKPAQTQHFTYNISLEEYLKIYDIRFECQPLLCRSAKIAEDIFNDVKAGGYDVEKFPKRKLKKNNIPSDNRQNHTKWFEEFIYYKLKNELNLSESQIATGLKLFSESKEKEYDKYGNDNEIDVLMIYQNRPFLVECKFSLGREHINLANLTNHIYKLAAINKRFGISAKSAIFTLSDLTSLSENARKGLVRRLAISGVSKIFDRNLINNNFASHLKEFLKQ